MARIIQQPAYVLHGRPYRETSLLLEVLSRDHGRAAMVARGARGPKSRLRHVLQPFRPLLMSWNQTSDLGTLTAADQVASPPVSSSDSAFLNNQRLGAVVTVGLMRECCAMLCAR